MRLLMLLGTVGRMRDAAPRLLDPYSPFRSPSTPKFRVKFSVADPSQPLIPTLKLLAWAYSPATSIHGVSVCAHSGAVKKNAARTISIFFMHSPQVSQKIGVDRPRSRILGLVGLMPQGLQRRLRRIRSWNSPLSPGAGSISPRPDPACVLSRTA